MTEIGSVINGKYEILTEIGRGGMSVVYLAMDKNLNKQWAIKEIRKKGSEKNDEIVVNSLLAEANMMKKLDHPALPRIVDIIDTGITIYIVMDYIEGSSLDKIMGEFGSQSEELVISWAKQLCDALSYLHSQKPPIIYRDMKPANVMLKPEGNIKIIDFGIAREYKEQNLSDTTVLGTKGYAPPEQYNGQTDERSDIFALGMTLHHLLTGVDPRSGEAYASVRLWNPDVSEGLEAIIDKCVQPAAENRYQTCSDLLYDLEHPELITSGFKRRQKRRLATFLTCAILAVVSLVLGVATNVSATQIKNSDYETLIGISTSSSYEEKVESYTEAIALYPDKIEAYMKLMETYEYEGSFTAEQSQEFTNLYNIGKSEFDTSSVEYAELNYLVAMMYFNYYTENGSYKIATCIQKAFPFFEINSTNENLSEEFEYATVGECYYRICNFYSEYILETGTNNDEAKKEDYEELFDWIWLAIEELDADEKASDYNRLCLYNAMYMLIYDKRAAIVSNNVAESEVIELMQRLYSEAESLVPSKQRSITLRTEIVDNYDLIEAVQRQYSNNG